MLSYSWWLVEKVDMLVMPMTHYDAILGIRGIMHTTQ